MFFPWIIGGSQPGKNVNEGLFIEPAVMSVDSGENVTFTCFSPTNVSFVWHLGDDSRPFSVTKGFTTSKHNNVSHFWSSIELLRVKRTHMKRISCSAEGKKPQISASLIVKGIRFGDVCESADDDCITDRAQCLSGICSCPENKVHLLLKPQGKDICSEIIYKLYEPCEFSEQCYKLVDPHSLCGTNGICTCASWAVYADGKCVPKGEYSYNKNQEMYRVGLIAVTCVIIIIVAVSLWVTLRRSCHEQISITPRRSAANIRNIESPHLSSMTILEIASDKPPSYDELVEPGDTVSPSPPSIKDALKNCITAKKLIRQASAPAGQLVTMQPSPNNSQSHKSGCVSSVFTNDE